VRPAGGKTEIAFRTWLRELRQNAGLSQEELAEAVGTDRRNIRRWEVEGHDPGGTALLRILSAVGVVLQPPLPDGVPKALSAEIRDVARRLSDLEERLGERHDILLTLLEQQEELLRALTARLGAEMSSRS
jgi:transcriptional regulator with XRE-family HTH domain